MKKITIITSTAIALMLISCSASSKYKADPSITKEKAYKAYSNLNEETGETPTNYKGLQNSNIESSFNNTISYPTIMVIPSHKEKNKSSLEIVNEDPMSKTMMEAINGFLTKKNYEVKSLEGGATLDEIIKMQNDISNTEDDIAYLASLAIGADIYIKFSGTAQNDNVFVEVSAYETSTARLLGSQSAEVKNNGFTNSSNLYANAQSAARKAMPNLEKKILDYWKSDLKKGEQYKVVINVKGEYTDNQIEELQDSIIKILKSTFNSVTVNVMTNKTIDVIIYANPSEYSDSQDIYSQIRNSLKSLVETKKISITKKLILMDIR